ncbi:MAG: thioredoxin family protein [Armatimonadota bacterium]
MRRQKSTGLLAFVVAMGLVVAVMPQQAAAAPTGLPQLIELYSPTCSHCQRMMPIIDKVRTQLQGKAEVVAINIMKDTAAADKYQVSAIPTLIFLNAAGKEIFRHVGEYPEAELQAKLREFGWR